MFAHLLLAVQSTQSARPWFPVGFWLLGAMLVLSYIYMLSSCRSKRFEEAASVVPGSVKRRFVLKPLDAAALVFIMFCICFGLLGRFGHSLGIALCVLVVGFMIYVLIRAGQTKAKN